ncbi:hypothetical protein B0H14DRAFT_3607187 [Mycena olivaceomarginata]|nr:hypothetical protein B0H14DRAFT_3607187 [Mycena olivaceomarginata]
MIIPQLPVELITEILSAAWHMPLSTTERITFMRSSALVNSTWADIFNLVALRDVYIPSAAFSDHFLQCLRAQPTTAASSSGSFGRLLDCFRSPARPHIQSHTDRKSCVGHMRLPMGGVLDSLLETLDAWSLAPNLRRLSIEYVDTGFEDIFNLRWARSTSPANHPSRLAVFFQRCDANLARRVAAQETAEAEAFRMDGAGCNTVVCYWCGREHDYDLLFTCPNVQTLGRERGSV